MFPTGLDWVGRVARRGVPALPDPESPGVAGVQAWPRRQSRGPVAASLRPSGARVPSGAPPGRPDVPLPLTPRNWSKHLCILLFSRVAGKVHPSHKPKGKDLRGSPWGKPSPWSSPPERWFPLGSGSDLRTRGVA